MYLHVHYRYTIENINMISWNSNANWTLLIQILLRKVVFNTYTGHAKYSFNETMTLPGTIFFFKLIKKKLYASLHHFVRVSKCYDSPFICKWTDKNDKLICIIETPCTIWISRVYLMFENDYRYRLVTLVIYMQGPQKQ